MDKTTTTRQGEALTVWVPKGTKAHLSRHRLKYGKRSTTHLVCEILEAWKQGEGRSTL